MKRRPGTAGRKNQLNFGKKLGIHHNTMSSGQVPGHPSTVKSINSHPSIDVAKLRPKVIHQERERLYDDVMKQRVTSNNLHAENVRLRTRMQMVETELNRKEKVIDDLI